ncbi:MAG TPA: protoglobin domain-containing protein [Chitinophaga sp.]|uniref:protoglobin domain-containing protein n=1 Tax=Chitinophaga sp. TaxID=1869181 RepID=UPI002B7565AD|nr:protoglobin domain-containing protein [Chitinophaga sp.]HVI48885.1 protoglobin domain-containing protein [Chitinophaga sp.]
MDNAVQKGSIIPDPKGSSVDAQTLVKLKRMMLFTQEDEQMLTLAGELLAPHAEAILNRWYEGIAANHYLANYFTSSGSPDLDYIQSLRPHFREWITRLCERPESGRWWEFEQKIISQLQAKNQPLNDLPAFPAAYLRYIFTFIYPISEIGREYLINTGHKPEDVSKMHQAWYKAVSLSVLLWIYPSSQQAPF